MAGNPMSPVSNLGFPGWTSDRNAEVPVGGHYVDSFSGPTWVPDQAPAAATGYPYGAGMNFGLSDVAPAPAPAAPASYPYGAGMDFGLPDVAPALAAPAPALVEPAPALAAPAAPAPAPAAPAAPAAPTGYPYGAGMDVGVSDQGFNNSPTFGLPDIAPIATSGPRYQYGTGMGFGLPDVAPSGGGGGGHYVDTWGGPTWVPDQASQMTNIDFGYGLPVPQTPVPAAPQMSNIDFGYGLPPAPPAPQMTNIDFGYGLPPVGGGDAYSPGDMGDAITNQQHEYMNAARALAAQEAAYQQRVQSERAAVDASLAAAAAQRNNPLYNPSAQYSNISSPTVNFSGGNPTDNYNIFASLRGF